MATSTTALTPEYVQKLLNGPAGTPPVGVTPNFDNPPNLNTFTIITLVLCVSFATVAVLIRMYTKLFLIRSIEYEDYIVMIAWIGQIGETIPSGLTTRYGGGIHIWNVQLKAYLKLRYRIYICSIVYGPVIFFIKLSILLQYCRIFRPTRQGNMFLFVGVHVCIWSVFLFYFVSTIFEIVICVPHEKTWNPFLTTGHCSSTGVTFEANGIFNVLSDFAILLLPIPTVWQLKVPTKKKIEIIAVFSAGFFACATSILRTYYTWIVLNTPDVTYNITWMELWTYAEISVGIIVSCLPISPRFFQFLGPKISGSFSFRFKSETKSDANPDSTGSKEHLRVPKFERPFANSSASGAWNGPDCEQAYGEHITLDETGI